MLRKCFAFMLIVSLLCPVSVVAGIPESHMYHFTVMEMVEIPLAQALTQALGDDFTLLDCYATTRFHQWRYGQAVIRDGEGYALCCLDYLDGAWRVTVSHDALRQDEPPRLLPEGVEYGYTDEQVGQMDGCASFKIIYPDVTYRWFAGSDSWNMISVITEEEELDVSHDSLCRWNKGQDKVEWLLNVLPLDLERFRIADFPTTWEAAQALSQTSPEADESLGRIQVSPRLLESHQYGGMDEPLVPLYAEAEGKNEIARLFTGAPCRVKGLQNGFAEIDMDGLTGWVEREHVQLGAERANSLWDNMGENAQVYLPHGEETVTLQKSPADTAAVARLPGGAGIYLRALIDDGRWVLAVSGQDEIGCLPFANVCKTDNFHNAWIYSADPSRRLNLRSGPGTKYDVVGKYYSGVEVIQLFDPDPVPGWQHVAISGVDGWVNTDYLCYWDDYNGRDWLPPLAKIQGVNEKGLNLREGPTKESAVKAAFGNGNAVEILGVTDTGWAHVRLQSGMSGYMMVQYLGGAPQKADKNRFTLSRDITAYEYAYHGDYTIQPRGTVKKGSSLRIEQRPCDHWIIQADGSRVYGLSPYVFTTDLNTDTGLWVDTREIDFWK